MPSPSIFFGMDQATLRQMLADAQQAYAKLLNGTSASEIVTQGDVVKFRATKPEQIEAFIFQIQAALAGRPTSGAIGMVF